MRIDGAFKDDYFIDVSITNEGSARHRLLTIGEVRKQLVKNNVAFRLLKKSSEVRAAVYSTVAHEHPVVKLRKGASTEAIAKLYYYLLNTRYITATALKQIVLIANGRSGKALKYEDTHIEEIERVRRLKQSLAQLENAHELFVDFRRRHRDYMSAHTEWQLRQARFGSQLGFWRKQTQKAHKQVSNAVPSTQANLKDARAAADSYTKEIGSLEEKHRQSEQKIRELDAMLRELSSLSEPLLQQEQLELKHRSAKLQVALTNYEADGRPVKKLERDLKQAEQDLATASKQLETREAWLVNQLSPKLRTRAEAILAENLARSTEAQFQQLPTTLDSPLTLGDGVLELPAGFADSSDHFSGGGHERLEIQNSQEQLRERINTLQRSSSNLIKLLTTARQREELDTELQTTNKNLKAVEIKLQRLAKQPAYIDQLDEAKRQMSEYNSQLKGLDQQREESRNQVNALERQVRDAERETERLASLLSRIDAVLREVERWPINDEPPTAEESEVPQSERIERTFSELRQTHNHLETTRNAIGNTARELRERTGAEAIGPEVLIEELEQRYGVAKIERDDYRIAEDALIKQLAAPAGNLLDDYGRFAHYVSGTFNSALRKIEISDLKDLRLELEPNRRLHSDLKAIRSLNDVADDLFSANERDERRGLDLVRRYVSENRSIPLDQLFDLHLRMTRDGKSQRIDLDKQVESEGTNKLLRLVLALTATKELLDGSAEERLAIFLDEVATLDDRNRPALADFCRDHHFVPVFAAPKPVDGFERYVFLSKQEGQLQLHQTTRERI